MSALIDEAIAAGKDGELGSLSQRIAQRRRERERLRGTTVVLPVPGYSDLFGARYRRLEGTEIVEISERPDVANDDEAGALDMLINGCTDILAVDGFDEDNKPIYTSLGMRWTTATITQLFEQEFPPDFPVRAALRQVLDYKEISKHFKAYLAWMNDVDAEHTEATPGE
jgi:hypothetical protein